MQIALRQSILQLKDARNVNGVKAFYSKTEESKEQQKNRQTNKEYTKLFPQESFSKLLKKIPLQKFH